MLDRLRAFFASDAEVSDAIAPLGLDAATQRAVLDRSAKLAERWTTLASLQLRELVHFLVQQIQIDEAQILVWLNRAAIVSSVTPNAFPKLSDYSLPIEPLVLSITATLRRMGKGMRLVIGNGAAKVIDGGLASLIARAMATRNMLFAGRDDSIDAMALRLGVRRDYLAVLVRLSYLSPEIIRAILVGQQPIELTPTRLDALQKSAARLPGAMAAPRICPCLTPRNSHSKARHLTGRKRASETPSTFARLRPRLFRLWMTGPW